MAIYSSYLYFRHVWATKIVATKSVTFTADATNDRAEIATGNWVDDFGLGAGIQVSFSGSTNNDFGMLFVDRFNVSKDIALFTVGGLFTNEGPVSVEVTAQYIGPDGYPEWPGPTGRGTNLVRANGFSDDNWSVSLSGPYAGSAFTVSINGGAADASTGVDEYDWYLSQRTDDPTKQYLAMTQTPDAGGNSYSGSVDIVHTDLAEDEMPTLVSKNVSVAEHTRLFKNCYLYVRRRSDGAIQWLDLQRATGV